MKAGTTRGMRTINGGRFSRGHIFVERRDELNTKKRKTKNSHRTIEVVGVVGKLEEDVGVHVLGAAGHAAGVDRLDRLVRVGQIHLRDDGLAEPRGLGGGASVSQKDTELESEREGREERDETGLQGGDDETRMSRQETVWKARTSDGTEKTKGKKKQNRKSDRLPPAG